MFGKRTKLEKQICFEKTLVSLFLVIALIGGGLLGVILYKVESRDHIQKLASFRPNLPTRLYDVNGKLIAELFQHKRKLVNFQDIPRSVVIALLAVEDSKFYDHIGMDFMGLLRAMIENIKAGRIVQGGSTITQQLVKGLFTKGEKKITRKVSEAILALEVERKFSKNEILEMYFNQIYYGHGAYGIASAARFYFDKDVSELNIMEGSILAALPKSPHTFSPIRNFHQAYKKNRIILNRLVDLGYLTREESDRMYATFWPEYWKRISLIPATTNIFGQKSNKAPYFTEHVRQRLEQRYGKDELYGLGLQVYTTLNLDHQEKAEEALLPKLEEQDRTARYYNVSVGGMDREMLNFYNQLRLILPLSGVVREYSLKADFRQKFKQQLNDSFDLLSMNVPADEINKYAVDFSRDSREFKNNIAVQGAFISLEPKTGRITAMIGGREFKASDQFNRAVSARRQPGSAFKPFVYGAALEDRAVHFASGFLDAPIMNLESDGSMWAPTNYFDEYRGYVLLHRALAMSLNLVSIQVYDRIGPGKVIDFASRVMKVPTNRFQPNPSLALGSSEVTPLELTLGFAVVANGGKDLIPHTIRYVTDRDGNVIYDNEAEIAVELNEKLKKGELQIIEPSIAYILQEMLIGVATRGTAVWGIKREGKYYGSAAGKTGTTSAWNDAWFAGYNGELAAVVWMGLDNGSMTLGRHQSGGALCTPVWGEFMRSIYKGSGKTAPKIDRTRPRDVRVVGVCKTMGKYTNPECPDKFPMVRSYFPPPRRVGGERQAVNEGYCDCNYEETKGILDFVQEDTKLSDEELGKTKSYRSNFGND